MTSITQAIKAARSKVHVIQYGRGSWAVHRWSEKHNATWVSDHMDYYRAAAHAKDARIAVALNELGIEDAEAEAYTLAQEEGRWDVLVREFVTKHPVQQ